MNRAEFRELIERAAVVLWLPLAVVAFAAAAIIGIVGIAALGLGIVIAAAAIWLAPRKIRERGP